MSTVLHITAEGVRYWRKSGGHWHALQQPDGAAVHVVTDLPEDALVEIQVPRLYGRDRQRLIARQLASRYTDTRFRAALPPQRSGSLAQRLAPGAQTLVALEPADRVLAAIKTLSGPLAGVWTNTVLMAQLGQDRRYPTNLLLVLARPAGMRVVFLKNRNPVLTRLVTSAQGPAEQAAELLRTVRHLENTRVLERGVDTFAALLLGAPDALAEALEREGVAVVPPATPRGASAQDWQHALFDLASKHAPGQLAPLSDRAVYVASHVKRYAWLGAAALGLVTAGALALFAGSVFLTHTQVSQLQERTQTLGAQIRETETAIQRQNISLPYLRRVLALSQEDMESAPSIRTHMHKVAKAVTSVGGISLKSFQWRMLEPQDEPCSGENRSVNKAASASSARAPLAAGKASGASPAPAMGPQARVEIQIAVEAFKDEGSRTRQRYAQDLSAALEREAGARVLRDPLRKSAQGVALTAPDIKQDMRWCALMQEERP